MDPPGRRARSLVMEHLISKFGLSMVHVPYKGGAGPATTALLGGEVSSLIVNPRIVHPAREKRAREDPCRDEQQAFWIGIVKRANIIAE
jgi:hypothetical protein